MSMITRLFRFRWFRRRRGGCWIRRDGLWLECYGFTPASTITPADQLHGLIEIYGPPRPMPRWRPNGLVTLPPQSSVRLEVVIPLPARSDN